MDDEKSGKSALEKLVLGEVFLQPRREIVGERKARQVLKRAWLDDDDDETQPSSRGRRVSLPETPPWAELDRVTSGTEDGRMARRVDDYVLEGRNLAEGTLRVQRCRNLNFDCPETKAGRIQCVEFHPKAKVALVVGRGQSVVNLVQVDGEENAKIQSVRFEDFGVDCARFTADGLQMIVGSKRRKSFYCFDMMSAKIVDVPRSQALVESSMGEFVLSPREGNGHVAVPGPGGTIHLLCSRTKEWLCNFKMNGNVGALAFDRDGERLYSHGDEGHVYAWDTRTRRCLSKFRDDGCLKGTALAVSPNGQYIACGSDSGVVNVYETTATDASTVPRPRKALFNLTTSVSRLKFNSSSEILAMSSRFKDDALRLVHLPGLKTFSNFPSGDERMGKPTCFDVSVNGGYLAVGCGSDSARLYRLRHYGNY